MERTDFNLSKYNMLKKAYNKAHSDGEKYLKFEGRTILVGYAKCMIEYLSKTFE